MRGEDPEAQQVMLPFMRNTPTCVGKTPLGLKKMPREQKHPHVRGEDAGGHGAGGNIRETPPRAWGRRSKMRSPK